MKELSIEEKAKRFDEVLGKARRYYDEYKTRDNILYVEDMEDMFPELKESEDERIKGRLINLVKMSNEVGGFALHKWEADEMIAWLEKQGEQKKKQYQIYESTKDRFYKEGVEDGILIGIKKQKPAWSEEDSPYYDDICEILINLLHSETADVNKDAVQKDLNWFKFLKDRAQLQPKQEWSKEDDGVLLESISVLQNNSHWVLADKLKSLKDRYAWKPSDLQIEALESATANCAYSEYEDCLTDLIEQLKKLKG